MIRQSRNARQLYRSEEAVESRLDTGSDEDVYLDEYDHKHNDEKFSEAPTEQIPPWLRGRGSVQRLNYRLPQPVFGLTERIIAPMYDSNGRQVVEVKDDVKVESFDMFNDDGHNDQVINKPEKKANKEPSQDDILKDSITCLCLGIIAHHIMMCENGHPICEVCLKKLQGKHGRYPEFKCPSCNQVGKPVRNLPLEKATTKIMVECPNEECGASMVKSEYLQHFATCKFRDIACPIGDCSFTYVSGAIDELLIHVLNRHKHTKIFHGQDVNNRKLWWFKGDNDVKEEDTHSVRHINHHFIVKLDNDEVIFCKIVVWNSGGTVTASFLDYKSQDSSYLLEISFDHQTRLQCGVYAKDKNPKAQSFSLSGTTKYRTIHGNVIDFGALEVEYLCKDQDRNGSWNFTSPIFKSVRHRLESINEGLSVIITDFHRKRLKNVGSYKYFCDEDKVIGTLIGLYYLYNLNYQDNYCIKCAIKGAVEYIQSLNKVDDNLDKETNQQEVKTQEVKTPMQEAIDELNSIAIEPDPIQELTKAPIEELKTLITSKPEDRSIEMVLRILKPLVNFDKIKALYDQNLL